MMTVTSHCVTGIMLKCTFVFLARTLYLQSDIHTFSSHLYNHEAQSLFGLVALSL